MLDKFKNLSLGKKQLYVLLAAGLVPMLLIAIISLTVAKAQVREQALDQLEAVRDIKSAAVSRYFETVALQLKTMASAPATADAMSVFERAFERLDRSERLSEQDYADQRAAVRDYYVSQFGEEYKARNDGVAVNVDALIDGLSAHTVTAQYLYIASNPDPLGEKHLMDAADGRSAYHRTHANFHPGTREFLESFGFYDIFLIDIETGDIVYSVFKELDYGTSLRTGPYKDTNFARAFRRAADMEQGDIAFEDFEQYRPSYDAPASFIASPIFSEGRRVGVLVFQIPLEPVNDIMSQRSGMGETGESYLVGEDLLMRSDSYLDPDGHSVAASFKHPEVGVVDTEATEAAFSGETGEEIIIDYDGNPVLSAYSTIDVLGERWAILAEIDVAEAFAGVNGLQWTIVVCWFAFAGALVFLALQVSRLITAPILALSTRIQKAAESGHFESTENVYAEDEVGQTARAFDRLQASIGEAISNTNGVLQSLSNGEFGRSVPEHYQGDLQLLASGVNAASKQIQEANERQAEQAKLVEEKARESERQARQMMVIKQAIDVSATPAIITDEHLKIVYMNHAADDLMSRKQTQLQSDMPLFKADALVGSQIDIFSKASALKLSNLTQLRETEHTRMEAGGLTFAVASTAIRDKAGQFLGVVVEWEDLTESLAQAAEEKRVAQENARIRQALDNSSTATMITDASMRLIYSNDSFAQMMGAAESDIRLVNPGFNAQELNGSDLSKLYSAQSDASAEGFANDFALGELNFSVISTPIQASSGELLGSVVEWKNRTSEVRVETEIDGLIASASDGDFSLRLNTEGKDGFFLSVSEGLNQLVELVSTALEDMISVFSALSKGDLGKKIEKDYMGDFGRLKHDANFMVDKLRET
jgi:methyl-accepting chemotaxis protein